MLILIMGLPGTGKTTFARALAEKREAVHLNSDQIRAEIGKRGLYDAASKEAVYTEMLRRTGKYLEMGREVIVDSTFYKESIRAPFINVADQAGKDVHWIVVTAKEATLRKRLQKNRPDSEADFTVYQRIKAQFEPLSDEHLTLPSDQLSLEKMVEKAMAYLGADAMDKR